MDTTQLQKQNKTLPGNTQKHIDDLQNESLKFKLMPNFSKDIEQSYSKGTNMYKGLTVEIPSNYRLSEKDKKWFHPDLLRSRSIHKITQTNSLTLDDFSSVVGTYYKSMVDELGDIKQERFIIVDTGIEDIIKPLWNGFFTGKTIKEVYSEIQFAKSGTDSISIIALKNAKKYAMTEVLSSYKYNMLFKGNGTYHFFNHVMKPTMGKALVHVSPLIGFYEIQTSAPVASDLLSEQTFIDINNLKKDQIKRVYNSCNWTGENAVNTFTMRKPIKNYKNYLKDSVMYRMEKGQFSATNLSDKLPLNIILFLTPKPENLPLEKANQFHPDVKNNVIRMKATDDSLSKLIPYYKQLFKENLFDGEDLVLSRELAQKL